MSPEGVCRMMRRGERETPSLKWIHRVREQHYQRTKDLPVNAWLRPVDVKEAAQALRRLGLRVRTSGKKRADHPRG